MKNNWHKAPIDIYIDAGLEELFEDEEAMRKMEDKLIKATHSYSLNKQTMNLDELDKNYIKVGDNYFTTSIAKDILLEYIEKDEVDWSDEVDKLTDDLIMLIKENGVLKEKVARLEREVFLKSN